MRKLTVLAMLSAGMGFGTQALADTTIGFTIYKYDDNFMSELTLKSLASFKAI
ncbi:methyl-galactoside ABC transporter substrate-binding protein MglB [Vibrio cholerae]|nr:methyl-galactoside ABC transporter substrate-binding protein MglB [Vibrio cholerae]